MNLDWTLVYVLCALSASLAFVIGALMGRASRQADNEHLAQLALHRLRAQQREADDGSIRQLPPMVDLADALTHAAKLGVSVSEAADHLYTVRVRALLDRERRNYERDLRP